MNEPKYAKVDGQLYEINTDFRVALECNKIARDKSIGDYERAMAVIYKLFGEPGLDCKNQNKLLEIAMEYITLGRQEKPLTDKPYKNYELDFSKCEGLIRSSFIFDYNYDPYEKPYLHWYKFYNDLENLSTSEFGTCCALNRIISILNQDTSEIKDSKEKQKIVDAQKYLINKYCITTEKERTKEQEESARAFLKALNLK